MIKQKWNVFSCTHESLCLESQGSTDTLVCRTRYWCYAATSLANVLYSSSRVVLLPVVLSYSSYHSVLFLPICLITCKSGYYYLY